MACHIRDMSVLAYANGFTLWHYKASDPLDTLAAKGFFDPMRDMVATGDLLVLGGGDGTRVMVVAASGRDVALAPLS